MQDPAAPNSDDIPGNVVGNDPDGSWDGSRERAICSAGASGHWWLGRLRRRNRIPGPAVYLIVHGRQENSSAVVGEA